MSTNDDSASRRGRRADQGGSAWRNPNRQQREEGWDQPPSGNRDSGAPYNDQRGRDNQSHQAAYSGFTRPSYSQRQEPAPQPPAQQPYYQDPAPRHDLPRYVEPAAPSYAPPPQHPGYGDGGRDDLFTREPAPQGYDPNPYGGHGSGYQQPYDQGQGRAPSAQPGASQDYYQREAPSSSEDYERSFGARLSSQDAAASRFYLPDERPQAPQRPAAPPLQAPADRGYAPAQSYDTGGYDPHGGQHDPYDQHGGGYDSRYEPQESWHGDQHGYHAQEEQQGRHLVPAHGDELDEDFFGDEDDYDHDELHGAPRRGRKKLILAAVAAALAAGGGAYYLKHPAGGDKAAAVIRADPKPSKEMPGNPGGKQYLNGEKSIYERLRPDGTTQTAPATIPAAAPVAPALASAAPAGNSLEDRIDEALNRVRRSGDAPPAGAGSRPGSDQPTVVRSESYRPDGTRVAGGQPVITPSITSVDNGLPYPFGSAPAAAAAAPPAAAPFRPAAAPPPQQPQQQFATMAGPAAPPKGGAVRMAARPAPAAAEPAAAAPAPATASGFYVSLKSAPDEKAIQKDLPALTKKYESVLGDVQLTTKVADLGTKGVTYRAVAGPLGSRQEAMDLCQKIKGVGGDKACFVTN
jgi:SPOR domain